MAEDRHSILRMGNLLMLQERERFLSKLFRQLDVTSLEGMRVFEAGCAGGYNLRLMVQWGARPADVAGMDIDPAAVDHCLARAPEIRVHAGSATEIPEPDVHFDLSLAFTLFSSVPDEDVARTIGAEMFRITKPGGTILVYDMRRKSPSNPNVHPVHAEDIRRWFPKCPMKAQSITLAPPVARHVGRWAPWLYGPLATIPLARTHMMYTLRRPALPII